MAWQCVWCHCVLADLALLDHELVLAIRHVRGGAGLCFFGHTSANKPHNRLCMVLSLSFPVCDGLQT
jgi:hypothetical protein